MSQVTHNENLSPVSLDYRLSYRLLLMGVRQDLVKNSFESKD